MTLASKIFDRFRSRLARWVEKERKIHGCAAKALRVISSKIKMSQTGIYRTLNGYGDVQIKAHQYMALMLHTMAAPKFGRKRAIKCGTVADIASELRPGAG